MTKTFEELGVASEYAAALRRDGILAPTPVQAEAIPPALAGQDVIAKAQTGTGKTLAFVLPMLAKLNPAKPELQALVLAPTRELALQITAEIRKLAPIVGANVMAVYGGQDVEAQIRKLKGAAQIVVATPGRLLDHLRRGTVELHKVTYLVLDEADQMLEMGFLGDVEEILAVTPGRRQTLLFSATVPDTVRKLALAYTRNPKQLAIESKQVTLDEISQRIVHTTDRGRQQALIQVIRICRPYLAMVFCRTKIRAKKLAEALLEAGLEVGELHGDLSQAKREQVMSRFRKAEFQILVATDVAARGLDVEGITHVINYDVPPEAETYIHRIGRTGRAGQEGMAVTLAAPKDRASIGKIERGIRQTLAPLVLPSGREAGAEEAGRGGRGASGSPGSSRSGRTGGRRAGDRPEGASRGRAERTGRGKPDGRRGRGGEARSNGRDAGDASSLERRGRDSAAASAAWNRAGRQASGRAGREEGTGGRPGSTDDWRGSGKTGRSQDSLTRTGRSQDSRSRAGRSRGDGRSEAAEPAWNEAGQAGRGRNGSSRGGRSRGGADRSGGSAAPGRPRASGRSGASPARRGTRGR